jgi:CheY-like chemotaxis protein
VLAPKLLELNAVIANLQPMLRRLIGEHIQLATALAPDLAAVRADPSQLEQVILNLAVNARDAMPNGGRLTIETSNIVLDEAYAREHPSVVPGTYVLLGVTDTGVGMDPDTKAHLFEPFFTTKPPGQGTGLGLATVYGVVKQSGGYVWVYSELGRGSSFKVYLPQVEGRVEAGVIPAPAPQPRPTGETVLLVEDEPAVRLFARKTLELAGYRVLVAPDGMEALQLAGQHPGPIQLLLTDVVMPGMSGRMLAERLCEARPALKVLYTSGYTDDAIVRHGVLDASAAFLQKPFSPETLERKIRDVLDH